MMWTKNNSTYQRTSSIKQHRWQIVITQIVKKFPLI